MADTDDNNNNNTTTATITLEKCRQNTSLEDSCSIDCPFLVVYTGWLIRNLVLVGAAVQGVLDARRVAATYEPRPALTGPAV